MHYIVINYVSNFHSFSAPLTLIISEISIIEGQFSVLCTNQYKLTA